MKYSKIIKYDLSNWDGINTTIFFSGCRFKCPGCFNKVAQDFNNGYEYIQETEDLLISLAKDEHVVGVCLLGGEPLQQDLDLILKLVKRIKKELQKPIHLWSGYLFEDILADEKGRLILDYIDTLVDGQFILAKKDLNLKYRGSSNQRVIDVQKSLKTGTIVEIA